MKQDAGHISNFSTNHPSGWDTEQFRENWFAFLESIVEESSSLVPPRRIRYQIEQTAVFQEVVADWESLNGSQRLDAWKKLLMCAEESSQDILPTCVQCGECCRKGSPTLHAEDIEILREGKIPWEQLVTLRKGEPALSPFDGRPFVLPEERIKIREKEGSQECVFLDEKTERCSIYSDRPLQCRAQACWDPMPARDLAEQPFLLRKQIFEGVDVLLEMISEHDKRCGFEALTEAFEKLQENEGKDIQAIVGLLSYEEHFREFVSGQFKIPLENMELLFGRSFVRMLPLFGYRVEQDAEGNNCIVPDKQA